MRLSRRGKLGSVADPAQARRSEAELKAELDRLPPNVKGEIIAGELYVMPRPRPRHARANAFLGHHIGGAFDFGEGGPGGWIVLVEPGIELPDAAEVAPDLAGWKRERFAWPPEGEPVRLVPDWVAEVLSPSNAAFDRKIKFPFYARVGVSWLWVVDPRDQTIEIRRLDGPHYRIVATFAGDEPMRAEPFDAIEIPLGRLWVDGDRPG